MLFRGPHENNDAGAIGSRSGSEHSSGEDETCSTGGRSYTSAESATAQSFEMRMAQLDSNNGFSSGNCGGEASNNNNTGSDGHKLLSPGYQLFPTGNKDLDGNARRGEGPHNLTLVSGVGDGERGSGDALSGTQANNYPDEDEHDDEYLTALLCDIERHAARLDTQFFRYPSAESLKQQMAPVQETYGNNGPVTAAAAGTKASNASAHDRATKAEASADSAQPVEAAAATPTATVASVTATTKENNGGGGGSSTSAHSTGTKLFLGGLRYEVIQSGRQTVSWIFQVACGVHINPSSILIHRKTKNGRSNVAPTGCASVFVADDGDVATLLEMNQRIYCAEEGVYVSPSPDVMKELIASKDIVDVTGGRVRGPTHPVVIERAYSVSHHHGHHGGNSNSNSSGAATAEAAGGAASGRGHGSHGVTSSNNNGSSNNSGSTGNANAGGSGGNQNAAAVGSGGGHNNANRHARTSSAASADSNLSNKLMGGMPPPYGGAMPPQYSNSNVLSAAGTYHPPSYAPSSVPSSSFAAPQMGIPLMGASPSVFPPGTMMLSGQSNSSMSQSGMDDGRSSNAMGPLKFDSKRVTFHSYLRGSGNNNVAGEQSSTANSTEGASGARGVSVESPAVASTSTAHTVLFLAALPSDATEEYVSWLFSLMSIPLPTSKIHIFGGGVTPGAADCCATVSVSEGDVSIALNFHHRVLCTSRGAWIGYSPQDIAALRASDPSLRDSPVLHVDRRMFSQSMPGGGNNSNLNTTTSAAMGPGMPSGYPHSLPMGGGSGCPSGAASASMPPPPTSYAHVFGAMPLPSGMPAGPGGVLPITAPWGFAAPPGHPGMPSDGLFPKMPPPPPRAMMGGAAAVGLPPGAMSLQTMMAPPAPGSAYSIPPPPFSFAQSVTIGDRTYQLPPGATVQYVPVITTNQGAMPPGTTGDVNASTAVITVAGASATSDRLKSSSSHASAAGNESA